MAMEFPCAESNAGNIMMMRRRNNLTLQKYLDFTETHKLLDLTINSLNQIVSMHGFKKLKTLKTEKNVLIDAVESIELMDLTRSTLRDDHISSCAFITPEEAIKDLIGLSWIECSVTSFKTLNSVNYDSMNLQISNNIASASKSKSKKKQPKFGTKTLKDQIDLDGKECSVTLFKPPNSNSQPKKKKTKKVPTLMEGTESACSSAVVDHCTAKGKSDDCATGGSSSSMLVITGQIV